MELLQKAGQSELYDLFTKLRGTQITQIITELLLWLAVCGKLYYRQYCVTPCTYLVVKKRTFAKITEVRYPWEMF